MLVYKKATNDFSLAHNSPSLTAITANEGKSTLVTDMIKLKVGCRDHQYKLYCKLVNNEIEFDCY